MRSHSELTFFNDGHLWGSILVIAATDFLEQHNQTSFVDINIHHTVLSSHGFFDSFFICFFNLRQSWHHVTAVWAFILKN